MGSIPITRTTPIAPRRALGPGWKSTGLVVFFLTCVPSARAAEPASLAEFLARSEAALRDIAAAAPGAPARAVCGEHVEASFDLPALARMIAGTEIWARLGDDRRPAFQAALRARLVSDCARAPRGGTLALLATRAATDDLVVTARMVLADGGERILVWRLRAGGPWGLRAHDVTVDGIGLGAVLRDEVRAAFDAANGDVEAAIFGLARGALPR